MDDAFNLDIRAITGAANETIAAANALEDQVAAGDEAAIRRSLAKLCEQLDSIRKLLDGDDDKGKEGLFKRALRWSGLIRANPEVLAENERAVVRDKIIEVEQDTLKQLGVREERFEAMIAAMRERVASLEPVGWTRELLEDVSADIEHLHGSVCAAEEAQKLPQREALIAIVDGVHGVVKVVADVGKFALDPTLIAALCGVYSVVVGGLMVKGAVTKLKEIREAEEKVTAKKAKAEAEAQRIADEAEQAAKRNAGLAKLKANAPPVRFTTSKPKPGGAD